MKYLASFKWNVRRAAAFVVLLFGFAMCAYAAQTALTPQSPLGPYPGTVSAGQLALTFASSDNVNGNSFPCTGHEILLVDNTDAASQTVTISSVADQFGRTQDITAYSLAASTFAVFNFRGGCTGWKQTDGTVHVLTSAATVKLAVIQVQ